MLDVEEFLRKELLKINTHLPRRRVSLFSLLSTEEPHVVLRSGDVHYFRKSELELLTTLTKKPESLMLPLFLELSQDYRGYFIVRGREECKVIFSLLGDECEFLEEDIIVCPRYLLPRLRKLLPTTTTYVFVGGIP